MKRVQCPCCGNYPFANYDEAFFEICDICFWQYEETSHDKPDKPSGGANGMLSLNMARANYLEFGACERRVLGYVRAPLPEELPENNT